MIQIENVESVPFKYFSLGWSQGPPRGIMFHLSETSNFEDFAQNCEKFISSAHFYVSNSQIPTKQLVDVENRAWHAYEASHYYFGMVHECIPGQIYLTPEQLKESARVAALLIRAAKEKWGVSIPIIRAPGPGFSPGFKDCKDGAGSNWNPNMHTDGLTMTWTWNQYLEEVKSQNQEDDMAIFEDKADFRLEVRKAIAGVDKDGNPNLSPEEFLTSLQFLVGLNFRLANSLRPSESGPKQRGWDFGEATMRQGGEEFFPQKGKLVGTVTFGES